MEFDSVTVCVSVAWWQRAAGLALLAYATLALCSLILARLRRRALSWAAGPAAMLLAVCIGAGFTWVALADTARFLGENEYGVALRATAAMEALLPLQLGLICASILAIARAVLRVTSEPTGGVTATALVALATSGAAAVVAGLIRHQADVSAVVLIAGGGAALLLLLGTLRLLYTGRNVPIQRLRYTPAAWAACLLVGSYAHWLFIDSLRQVAFSGG